MQTAAKTRPPRTVLDVMIDHVLAEAGKSAKKTVAQATIKAAQRHIDKVEIERSQKAMTEQMRDRWFY